MNPSKQLKAPTQFDIKVFDGPAVVHALPGGDATTFGDYSAENFIRWPNHQFQSCKRMDIVWDIYTVESLKDTTREEGVKA